MCGSTVGPGQGQGDSQVDGNSGSSYHQHGSRLSRYGGEALGSVVARVSWFSAERKLSGTELDL